jgi:hypothetical protein
MLYLSEDRMIAYVYISLVANECDIISIKKKKEYYEHFSRAKKKNARTSSEFMFLVANQIL